MLEALLPELLDPGCGPYVLPIDCTSHARCPASRIGSTAAKSTASLDRGCFAL
ncbi:hypothetical protein [Streptomyces pristinaespiralis]|uniref:hypothetical protein n=1 Tax=Streptomyces pristinaespiralis TaxID=38300 RepID=UPI003839A8FB